MTMRATMAATHVAIREADEGDRIDGVQPSFVASPTSTAETSTVLRAAAEHDLRVVVRGNGTKLTWGAPPERVDLVVDMSALDRLGEHAAGDLVVTAQAGVRLDALQEQVASAGQHLALDETVAGSTLGGVIATSPSGPHRVATGTVRDLLIGITVVRADGVVAKSGGKVVKNVAGYDLGKLLTGSFGTLAVITEATFRLHPLPVASRWITATTHDADEASRLSATVVHSQVVPAAVEVDWPADGPGTVAVLIEGTEAGVEARSATVRTLLGPAPEATDDPQLLGSAYPWSPGDGGTALKLTCRISTVGEVLAAVRDAGHAVGVPIAVRGSAGAGVLYAALPPDASTDAVSEILRQLRTACADRGGSIVVLDAPAHVKAAVDVWGPIHGLNLMRRVKAEFDPARRLAPGRFVGGI